MAATTRRTARRPRESGRAKVTGIVTGALDRGIVLWYYSSCAARQGGAAVSPRWGRPNSTGYRFWSGRPRVIEALFVPSPAAREGRRLCPVMLRHLDRWSVVAALWGVAWWRAGPRAGAGRRARRRGPAGFWWCGPRCATHRMSASAPAREGRGSGGEFDPGSGTTLAACLTHASRAGHRFGGGERRTGEEHVTNLPTGGGQPRETGATTAYGRLVGPARKAARRARRGPRPIS